MNGKINYLQKNIVSAGKKIQSHHSQEFIVTVKIRELTNAHVVV
ncbi:uncharacterized protein METZ01_LOCUS343791 [marine metagenome]|uniref:Uncharacterized protein n=1 Tax=marine metagenome TaxID=408172 RepID=A0A382R126_9ZZZZ